jgi:predicted nucleotidyltransferase
MIEAIFGSKLRTKILGWLYTHTDRRYFVRQLTNLIKEDSTNVSRELIRLEKAGIVVSTTEGRQKYYQANSKSPIFNELKSIVRKTFGVADVIREALAPVSGGIKAAFIFGSVARSSDDRKSDIDVMIIGDVTFDEVVAALSPAENTLGREINSVVYPVAEFSKKVNKDHYFVKNVLGKEKIFLIGDEDELARLGR